MACWAATSRFRPDLDPSNFYPPFKSCILSSTFDAELLFTCNSCLADTYWFFSMQSDADFRTSSSGKMTHTLDVILLHRGYSTLSAAFPRGGTYFLWAGRRTTHRVSTACWIRTRGGRKNKGERRATDRPSAAQSMSRILCATWSIAELSIGSFRFSALRCSIIPLQWSACYLSTSRCKLTLWLVTKCTLMPQRHHLLCSLLVGAAVSAVQTLVTRGRL
jgi:hypothetical protein